METGRLAQQSGQENPVNLLANGNFKNWSLGDNDLPDNWNIFHAGTPVLTVAKESSIVKLGTYSCKLTREGGDISAVYQQFHTEKGLNYWKGRRVTFGCWVYATAVEVANIYIYDSVGVYSSDWHPGDGTWRLLTVTCTIDADATEISGSLWNSGTGTGADASCYFDGAMLAEGESIFAFSDKLPPPRIVTAVNTNTVLDDTYYEVETTGTITVTLPSAIGINGRLYNIKKMDSEATILTIATTGGQTIDGFTTLEIESRYTSVALVSNNANWVIV